MTSPGDSREGVSDDAAAPTAAADVEEGTGGSLGESVAAEDAVLARDGAHGNVATERVKGTWPTILQRRIDSAILASAWVATIAMTLLLAREVDVFWAVVLAASFYVPLVWVTACLLRDAKRTRVASFMTICLFAVQVSVYTSRRHLLFASFALFYCAMLQLLWSGRVKSGKGIRADRGGDSSSAAAPSSKKRTEACLAELLEKNEPPGKAPRGGRTMMTGRVLQ
jgi:hypothetical protein